MSASIIQFPPATCPQALRNPPAIAQLARWHQAVENSGYFLQYDTADDDDDDDEGGAPSVVLDPRAQTVAARQLHFATRPQGAERAFYRILQSDHGKAVQVDQDGKTAGHVIRKYGVEINSVRH